MQREIKIDKRGKMEISNKAMHWSTDCALQWMIGKSKHKDGNTTKYKEKCRKHIKKWETEIPRKFFADYQKETLKMKTR